MENFIEQLHKEKPEDREAILKGAAYRVVEGAYTRPLTKDELDALKEEFVQNQIKVKAHEDKLKKIQDEFKALLKPLKEHSQVMLGDLKTKTTEEEGHTYEVDDQDNKVMLIFDPMGNLITQRPLLPEERNLSISSTFNRAAND